MKNISRQMFDATLDGKREGKFGDLLPPGWGPNYTGLTRGFSKAFDCFGTSFTALHSTTPQIKRDMYNGKH